MEVGDLHYFAAPARAPRRLCSPRRRRAVLLAVASAAALLWLALLVASDGDSLRLARPAQARALLAAACMEVYAPQACDCVAARADDVFGATAFLRIAERTGGNVFADAAHGRDMVRLVQDCMARGRPALAD